MGYQNSFLFRESLNDTGTTPTVDSIYWSPDIICHDMVADPDAFFAENYDRDVSQAVHTGTALNFLYTRVKNLSKDATPAVGYINVYRTHSSLFMQPSLWRNNPIPTASGKRSLAVQSSVPGEIVTGGDFFRLSGLESNTFCMMGIVSDSPTPTLPESDFRTYDDFAYWFRRNPAVCARNLTVYSGTTRQFEGMHSLSNPESEEKEVFIRVRATDNVPAGTVYGIHCSALGIQQEQTVKEGEHNDFVVLTHLPPGHRHMDMFLCFPSVGHGRMARRREDRRRLFRDDGTPAQVVLLRSFGGQSRHGRSEDTERYSLSETGATGLLQHHIH